MVNFLKKSVLLLLIFTFAKAEAQNKPGNTDDTLFYAYNYRTISNLKNNGFLVFQLNSYKEGLTNTFNNTALRIDVSREPYCLNKLLTKAQLSASETDSIGFFIGNNVAKTLKPYIDSQINNNLIDTVFYQVNTYSNPWIKADLMDTVITNILKKKMEKLAKKTKQEGEDFLNNNKKRKKVKLLSEGVQYEVLKKGKGAKPLVTDSITVHYKGTFINGEEFDNSFKRKEPLHCKLNELVKGWQIALVNMPVGSAWKIYLPYQVAYGEQGYPPQLPGYSALIFEIELLDVKK